MTRPALECIRGSVEVFEKAFRIPPHLWEHPRPKARLEQVAHCIGRVADGVWVLRVADQEVTLGRRPKQSRQGRCPERSAKPRAKDPHHLSVCHRSALPSEPILPVLAPPLRRPKWPSQPPAGRRLSGHRRGATAVG